MPSMSRGNSAALETWDTDTGLYTRYLLGEIVEQRPLTQAELDAFADTVRDQLRDTNRAQLLQKAATALSNNATFLALNPPTTAQAVAQVNALTRQVSALIRLVGTSDLLDSTDGT